VRDQLLERGNTLTLIQAVNDEKTKIQALGTRKCFVLNPATGKEGIILVRILNEDLIPLSDSEELKLIEFLQENITLDSGKPNVPSSA